MEINKQFLIDNLTDCGALTRKQLELIGIAWPVNEPPEILLNRLVGRGINDFEASLFSQFRTHKTPGQLVELLPLLSVNDSPPKEAKPMAQAQAPTEVDNTGEGKKVNNPADVVQINADKMKQIENAAIVEAFERLASIDVQRKALNEQANEVRQKMNDIGIPTAALNAAYARYKKSEEARAKQDAAYMKCCNAVGVGFQGELFSL